MPLSEIGAYNLAITGRYDVASDFGGLMHPNRLVMNPNMKAVLIVAGAALLAPGLWAAVISFNETHDWRQSFYSYGSYGFYLLLMSWLGALAISASTWLLIRRFGGEVLIACVPWVLLVSAVYLLWILITSPGDSSCDIFCLSPHRGEMQDIALITGALLAGTSAPLWVWLAIGELVRSSRRSIGRDAA